MSPSPKCSSHCIISDKSSGEGAEWQQAAELHEVGAPGALPAAPGSCRVTHRGLCSLSDSSLRPQLLPFEVHFQRALPFPLSVQGVDSGRCVHLDCEYAQKAWLQVDLGSLCSSTSYRPTGSLWKIHSRRREVKCLQRGHPLHDSASVVSALFHVQ